MTTPIAIELKNVTKRYSRNAPPALDNVSMEIHSGERIGLIGANGSGKSTLMKLLLQFIIRDSGEIRIHGETNLELAKGLIGYLPESQDGLGDFTPNELLKACAEMNGLATPDNRISELLSFIELTDSADYLLSSFSKGMVQRVQLAIALLPQPRILFLDEPTSGLDPEGKKKLRQLLAKLENVTILYASHNLEELEAICDSVLLLHQGKLIKRIDLNEQMPVVLTFEVMGSNIAALETFTFDTVSTKASDPSIRQVEFSGSAGDVQQLMADLSRAGIETQRLRTRSMLEELYAIYVSSENPQ